jgi:hypothetical protein
VGEIMPLEKIDLTELKESISEENIKKILNLISTTKYGSVTIVIQDGRVIQIEKNEKIRLK